MGSFASTCAISGIPLSAGDPVRWYALTKNPYNEKVFNSHDLWFPRSFPVRAKYNDYGIVEDYDNDSPSVKSIVECLKNDMIEVGVGDNSYHDTPTAKGMSFEDTLNAIWNNRLQVGNYKNPYNKAHVDAMNLLNLDVAPREMPSESDIPGYPTLTSVTNVLKSADFNVVSPTNDVNAKLVTQYLVDELEPGRCRVRVSFEYGNKQKQLLKKVFAVLSKNYAAVITVGSGNYPSQIEIQLMPKVMKRKEYISWGKTHDCEKPLEVYQGMIHEEIWNELMLLKLENDYSSDEIEFDNYRNDIQNQWDMLNTLQIKDPHEKWLEMINARQREYATHASKLVFSNSIPFYAGLSDHWYAAIECHKNSKFSAKQIDEFLDDVAGFSMIDSIMSSTRYWWRPSFACGPQFAQYDDHINLFNAFKRATVKVKNNNEMDW